LHTSESEGGCNTPTTCATSYHGSTGPFAMAIDAARHSLPDVTTSICLFPMVRHQRPFLPSFPHLSLFFSKFTPVISNFSVVL